QHSLEDHANVFDDLLRYITDERYIRVDTRPVIVIYRPDIIPEVGEFVRIWRRKAEEAGLPGLHLVATNAFGFQSAKQFGFDAICQFPPHGLDVRAVDVADILLNGAYSGLAYRYEDVVATESSKLRGLAGDTFWIPGVMPGWDNEPRLPGRGHVYHGS